MMWLPEFCKKHNIKFKQDLIPVNKWSNPNRARKATLGHVWHWPAGAGQTASQVGNYFESLNNPQKQAQLDSEKFACTQMIIGLYGELELKIPLDKMAYHAGSRHYMQDIQQVLGRDPNRTTIGTELCHQEWNGAHNNATLQTAIKIGAYMMHRFYYSVDMNLRHYDVTGKECPRWFVRNPDEWGKFLSAMQDFYKTEYETL